MRPRQGVLWGAHGQVEGTRWSPGVVLTSAPRPPPRPPGLGATEPSYSHAATDAPPCLPPRAVPPPPWPTLEPALSPAAGAAGTDPTADGRTHLTDGARRRAPPACIREHPGPPGTPHGHRQPRGSWGRAPQCPRPRARSGICRAAPLWPAGPGVQAGGQGQKSRQGPSGGQPGVRAHASGALLGPGPSPPGSHCQQHPRPPPTRATGCLQESPTALLPNVGGQ